MIQRNVAAILGKRLDDGVQHGDSGGAGGLQQRHLIGNGRLAEAAEIIVICRHIAVGGIETRPAKDFLQVDEQKRGLAPSVRRIACRWLFRHPVNLSVNRGEHDVLFRRIDG